MADAAKLGPGWYVATSTEGILRCLEFDGRWWRDDDFLRDELPPGWTLGPRIEDLLRDAEYYRWLKNTYKLDREKFDLTEDRYDLPIRDIPISMDYSSAEFDGVIASEIAREKETP